MVCVILIVNVNGPSNYSPSRANIHWTGEQFAVNVCSHFGGFVA